MPVPRRQHARRWRPAQQRERGGRKRVDVAGARRRPVGGELGRAKARRARAPARRRRGRGQAEVDELHAPALGQDQVRRLDVAVDDRRVLRVQVRERLGRLGEVGEHARRRQTRSAPLAQQPRKVGALHPVHGHDVAVAVEEVLSNQRQRRMRGNREQDAGLVQELVAQPVVAHLADLQRDESVVLAVERLDHVPLAARTERSQHLIAVLDEPSSDVATCPRWAMTPSSAVAAPHAIGARVRFSYPSVRAWPLLAHGARAQPSGCFGHEQSTLVLGAPGGHAIALAACGDSGDETERRARRPRPQAQPHAIPHAQGRGARVPSGGALPERCLHRAGPSRASRRS